jgi:hypothetical protein
MQVRNQETPVELFLGLYFPVNFSCDIEIAGKKHGCKNILVLKLNYGNSSLLSTKISH